jgi:DNA-binding response OmpR family regulator
MTVKVLVVEDDNFLRSAYQAKLSKAGFEVQMAMDGEDALTILNNFIPDIILLDLVMPRKDGFATLEEIKKREALQNVPVIVTSNLGQQDSIDKVKAMGATDFITKTDLSINDLVDKINGYVGAK